MPPRAQFSSLVAMDLALDGGIRSHGGFGLEAKPCAGFSLEWCEATLPRRAEPPLRVGQNERH